MLLNLYLLQFMSLYQLLLLLYQFPLYNCFFGWRYFSSITFFPLFSNNIVHEIFHRYFEFFQQFFSSNIESNKLFSKVIPGFLLSGHDPDPKLLILLFKTSECVSVSALIIIVQMKFLAINYSFFEQQSQQCLLQRSIAYRRKMAFSKIYFNCKGFDLVNILGKNLTLLFFSFLGNFFSCILLKGKIISFFDA